MNEQVRLPLTQAQFGIWLGQSISPDSTRYNAAEYLKFEGDLDVVHGSLLRWKTKDSSFTGKVSCQSR